MTDDLTDLQALAQAATPGPWIADEGHGLTADGDPLAAAGPYDDPAGFWCHEDAAFIAAARDAVPALIARVRKAEAERDEARALAQHLAVITERYCEVTGSPETGQRRDGGCSEHPVAIRWEHGFADEVCEHHAATAVARGALVVPRAVLPGGDDRG